MLTGEFDLGSWRRHAQHPHELGAATLDWIFVMDSLNFCFWAADGTPPFTVEGADGRAYTGYWSLCAALNRALAEGIPITTPSFYATVPEETLQRVFRSATATEIPLFAERLAILHDNGRVLLEKYGGSFANLLDTCGHSAAQLVETVLADFPSFRDVHRYGGLEVPLLKRVQILAADVWGCYEGAGAGAFADIGRLTMFADYRVPQILRFLGALAYTDSAQARLAAGELLPSGDPLEVEIRACSITAVERIRKELNRLAREYVANGGAEPGSKVQLALGGEEGALDGAEVLVKASNHPAEFPLNAVVIDFYLYDAAKAGAAKMAHIPVHHVRSQWY